MIDKLEELKKRYKDVEGELSKPETVSDLKVFTKLNKEYKSLGKIVGKFESYKKTLLGVEEAKKIIETEKDEEFREIAKKELEELGLKKTKEEEGLKLLLIPKDPNDEKNVILEIRAGTGGDEAAIFAGDLLRMYQLYSEKNKWGLNTISFNEGSSGGYKEIVCSVEGEDVYGKLKFEAGTHRVQRVPNTETQGRVHTSAATVAVLPEAEEVDLKINESDLRIDVFRAGGPGGQSVNTTDSAVRITHIPTGLSVSQQDEKSQHKNKAKGMKILRARLYELERSRIDQERSQDRKSKIGTGDRSERIRTYNFPQGRVTDHRINLTLHKLDEFLSGEIHEEMNQELRLREQNLKLENLN